MSFSTYDSSAPSHPPRSSSPVSWSQDQLVRLEYEWRRLQRSFAYHPHVKIVPLQNETPAEYDVEFRVRTLCVADSGELEYAEQVPMRITLPPNFPYAPPTVHPLKGVFHPNISWEGIHLTSGWQPTSTLVDYIHRIGELLAWRSYDPESVVNPMAVDWMQANAAMLPIDPSADFAPDAGGDPLDRIYRNGKPTLQQIHKQLESFRDTMLELDGAPGPAEVRDFSRQVRQTLNLFEQPDVPDSLREEASQLDDWASELPASVDVWESLRSQRSAAQSVRAACNALTDKRDPLAKQLKALAALAPAAAPIDYASAVAAIPQRKAMEVVQLKLPGLVREADEILKDLHERVKDLETEPPSVPVREDTPLYGQLLEELSAEATASSAAREAASEMIQTMEPFMATARAEADAVRQIGLWREYLDLFTTSRVLGKKLADLGAAGIQAFLIESSAGVFGPFQLDEPVDLGSRRIAVRSTARNRLRLIDVTTADVIGRSDTGSLVINLAGAGNDQNDLTTFRLTERWEDLAVQFDFLVRQSGQTIVKLTAPPPASGSWTGQVLSALATEDSVRIAREQHRKESLRWRAVLQDLQAIGPVKARIETWNFVQRIGEVVPAYIQKLAGTRAALAKAEKDLASIISRCSRDLDTDRLIIPPKLTQPYSEQTRIRDNSQREIARLEKLIVQLGSQIARQMASGAVVGSALIPQFHILPPFPPELENLIYSMHDQALFEEVSGLEKQLNMPLMGGGWKPSEASPRPVEPPALMPAESDEPEAAPVAEESAAAAAGHVPSEEGHFATDEPQPEYGDYAEEHHFAVEETEGGEGGSDEVEM